MYKAEINMTVENRYAVHAYLEGLIEILKNGSIGGEIFYPNEDHVSYSIEEEECDTSKP